MKKVTFVFIGFLPVILFGQIDVDTIFLWDNDRGYTQQRLPAVAARTWGGYIAWQDARFGDYDVYRRTVDWMGNTSASNFITDDALNQYQEFNVDAEGNPTNFSVYVWEDSSYRRGQEKPPRIMGKIHAQANFEVWATGRAQKLPSVGCRDEGSFAVSWSSYDNEGYGNYPNIKYKLYDRNGAQLMMDLVLRADSILRRPPVSRVAYCDSGIVIVYDDSSANGTARSIYLQYRNRNGEMLKDRIKVSRPSGDYDNEEYPAVAVNKEGYGIIVWQDWRYGTADPDIYGVSFQMRQGLGQVQLGSETSIDGTTNYSRYPRVTVFPTIGEYVVVWDEDSTAGPNAYEVKARACNQGTLRGKFRVNTDTLLSQEHPDVACRNTDTCFIAWQGEEYEVVAVTGRYYDIFARAFYLSREGSQTGMQAKTTVNVNLIPDTVGGRRCWYFDDENYDDPLTPLWNEDPIDEPDSIYVDLDFAIVDQIMELNTNGQYFVRNEDTIPRRQLSRAFEENDALFIDAGYRTDDASAGVISASEQIAIVDYIEGPPAQPAMVEGNDFGAMYGSTAMFSKFKADYRGDGGYYLNGNLDTLWGVEGTSFKDLTLAFDYKSWTDNYVDSVQPINGAELILNSHGSSDRWIAGRCVGWGTYWKDKAARADSYTVYSTFMLSGIKSRSHPNTYAEFYRRLMGYLGLNCQPEPITSIQCSTYAALEGSVVLKWQVVSDNKPDSSAGGLYKLKLSPGKMGSEAEFNNAEEYYQTWKTADSAVGRWYRRIVYGLPPAETLVAALKVSDVDNLWDALGAEPQVVVSGDTLTPHTLRIGPSYGYFKDFLNKQEYINRRRINDTGTDYDSLFVTWSSTYFFTGFSRCDFRTAGDLFIYVDSKAGGADTTIKHSASGAKSYFFKTASDSFRPDYCFILEDNDSIRYVKWVQAKDGRAGYWDTTSYTWTTSDYSEDGTINNYQYSEIRIAFSRMGYTAGNPFKLVVLVQNEITNGIINAFPIFNPLGTGVTITQYYYWGDRGLEDGMVPARRGIIGIEEEYAGTIPSAAVAGLAVSPNPFTSRTKILLPAVDDRPADVSLKIFDASGRLVKNLLLHTNFSATQYGGLLPSVFNWEGKNDSGERVPGGVYFCELKTPEKTEVEKIIYVR